MAPLDYDVWASSPILLLRPEGVCASPLPTQIREAYAEAVHAEIIAWCKTTSSKTAHLHGRASPLDTKAQLSQRSSRVLDHFWCKVQGTLGLSCFPWQSSQAAREQMIKHVLKQTTLGTRLIHTNMSVEGTAAGGGAFPNVHYDYEAIQPFVKSLRCADLARSFEEQVLKESHHLYGLRHLSLIVEHIMEKMRFQLLRHSYTDMANFCQELKHAGVAEVPLSCFSPVADCRTNGGLLGLAVEWLRTEIPEFGEKIAGIVYLNADKPIFGTEEHTITGSFEDHTLAAVIWHDSDDNEKADNLSCTPLTRINSKPKDMPTKHGEDGEWVLSATEECKMIRTIILDLQNPLTDGRVAYIDEDSSFFLWTDVRAIHDRDYSVWSNHDMPQQTVKDGSKESCTMLGRLGQAIKDCGSEAAFMYYEKRKYLPSWDSLARKVNTEDGAKAIFGNMEGMVKIQAFPKLTYF
jgi:hypothetical protein